MRPYLGSCCCTALLLTLVLGGCGGESKSADPGGSAGSSGSGGAGGSGSPAWDSAQWPMPNSPSLGLPNPASYDAETTPGVVHDLVTGLAWLQEPGTELYPRAEALSHCAELSFAGQDDWRAPAFIELVSLFDVVPNEADPLDPLYISPIFRAEGRFWAASVVSEAGLGRLLDFTAAGCGTGTSQYCSLGVAAKASDALGGAFCVRSEDPKATSARYQTNGEEVLDLHTGLTWQTVPAAVQTVDFADAVSACDALGKGARLPSINELLSILVPLLDRQTFPNWPSDAFAWSSSIIPAKPYNYWVGAIGGATKAALSTSRNRVECVR